MYLEISKIFFDISKKLGIAGHVVGSPRIKVPGGRGFTRDS